MKCPYCGTENTSRVVDTTRDAQGGIRRRRECKTCTKRFSTYERVLRATPLLIKSNGDREAFDREKLVRGIQISCAKRPIAASDITGLADEIETHLQNMGREEVPSRVVGDMVIEGLKELDPIAYIRYAIVYLGLDSLGSIQDLLDNLLTDANGKKSAKPAAAAPAKTVKQASNGSDPQAASTPPAPAEAPASKPDDGATPEAGKPL